MLVRALPLSRECFEVSGYGEVRVERPYCLPYLAEHDQLPWRAALVPGSRVDAKAKAGTWHDATVVRVEGRFLTLAFQTFSRLEDIPDNRSTSEDEEFDRLSIKIQPFNRISFKNVKEAKDYPIDDCVDQLFV